MKKKSPFAEGPDLNLIEQVKKAMADFEKAREKDMQSNQGWGGLQPDYHLVPCPSCGRCPTCGRGGQNFQSPYPMPYTGDPPYSPFMGLTSGGSGISNLSPSIQSYYTNS